MQYASGDDGHAVRRSSTATRRTHHDPRVNVAQRASDGGAYVSASPVTVSSYKTNNRNLHANNNKTHVSVRACASPQQQQQHSTRSLLSRLFRTSKSKSTPQCESDDIHAGEERASSETGARHSPILTAAMKALHVRDRSRHREPIGSKPTIYDEPEDLHRRGSAPAQMKSNNNQQHNDQQQQHEGQYYPTTVERLPTKKILFEGYLTKLSTHKYWHTKPSYFVLEETMAGTTLHVTLCQFRKRPHFDAAVLLDTTTRSELAVCEFVLSEDDAVIDISNRHTKHGFELILAVPEASPQPPSRASTSEASPSIWSALSSSSSAAARSPYEPVTVNAMQSLRFAAPDALSLENWISALGSAIAKLIFQTERHRRSDSSMMRGASNTANVVPSNNSNSKAIAKVAPMLPDGDKDELLFQEEIRQAEQQQQENDDEEEKASSSTVSRHYDEPQEPRGRDTRALVHEREPYRQYTQSDDNNNKNSVSDSEGDSNQDDNQNDDDHENEEERRPSCEFLASSPHTSSATSLTPSESSSEFVASQDRNNRSNHAFSNFVVSPNPPAQLTASGAIVSPYNNNKLIDQDELENELKTSSSTATASSRRAEAASSSFGASAFLRARFPRGHASSSYAANRRPQVHTFTANGQVFTLDTRYRLVKSIGTGAYGAVIAVQDSVTDTNVAVKKITNIFEDLVDAKRILREVRLLHHFQHKNITKLLDLAPPISKTQFEDMYIITELMETDLHQVIYSMQPMSDDHVKYFLYQMLCGLHHIHSAGVLHRDMKPSNILLNSNCDLKICDFGLARGGISSLAAYGHADKSDHQDEDLTEYVVTRWYRAPEIMLNCLQYTEAIDIWAVGCIFAEMLLREPLFPGNDYIHQLKLIIKFLGTPKQEDIEFVKNAKALRFLTKLAISKPKKWKDVFAGDDGINLEAIDLLSQMLLFNPAKRISIERALQHPYLATFYDPADITEAPAFDFGFDLPDDELSKEALIELLCEDIEAFHPGKIPRKMPTIGNNTSRFFGMGMTASAS